MQALDRLFQLRQSLFEYEDALGIRDYSEVEKAILEFIVSEDKTTISKIMKHPYFADVSLSTVNRVVAKLQHDGTISSEQSSEDKRKMNLSFCPS
ncbi:MAG: MarR family transcriptional regulator [PS1 clade bacterium]|jgi:DNA-binding MarR family transcriptional regulator